MLLSWLHQDSAAAGQPHPSEEEGPAGGTGEAGQRVPSASTLQPLPAH